MNPPVVLNFLCAGASQGLVKALQERFTADTGATLQGRFGAVGAMKEALLAGEPCDVMIVTAGMIDALCDDGRLRAASRRALGQVFTGVAVCEGVPLPDVSSPAALKAVLLAADSLWFPDPVRATAGIHFASVMRELGIGGQLQPRFRTFPAGAIAMREMAASRLPGAIGCTQVTEIEYTPGVELAGVLPAPFELGTVYSAAVATRAANAALAERWVEWVCGPASLELRRAGGFVI
jgi:molybdate transport system substrate-binding protein